MRKYRVWCKERNEWEKDDVFLRPDGTLVHLMRLGGFIALKPDSHIVEFFTGLKDSQGVEVYEGDIVEWYGFKLPITVSDFHSYRFIFGKDQLNKGMAIDGTVIGNIHEHPELLARA